jgi:hypothetical protein
MSILLACMTWLEALKLIFAALHMAYLEKGSS